MADPGAEHGADGGHGGQHQDRRPLRHDARTVPDGQGDRAGHGDDDQRGADRVGHRQVEGQQQRGHDDEAATHAEEPGEQADHGGGDDQLGQARAVADEPALASVEGDDRVVEPWSLSLAALAVAAQPAHHERTDEQHQQREERHQHVGGHDGGGPGTADGAADGDQPERQPLAEPDVPGAACGDRADRGGEPDDDQRPGGGLRGRLPEQVDEHRDGEDRSPASQGSQRQADEQPGAGRDDQHRDQASGPTIGRPAGAALSNSSSTATR